jgi:hypothetical protein
MPFSSKGALVHGMIRIRIRLGLGACYACIPKRFDSTWSLHHHMADPSTLTGLSPLIHQSYVLMVAFSSMAGATGGQSIQKSYNAMIGQRQLLPYRKGHKGCSVRGKRHARGVATSTHSGAHILPHYIKTKPCMFTKYGPSRPSSAASPCKSQWNAIRVYMPFSIAEISTRRTHRLQTSYRNNPF